MTYLDVAPMMVALRSTPDEFEMNLGWLRHIPSEHAFRFDPDGRVHIAAQCNCAVLAVRREQQQELYDAFQAWHASYWRVLEINREFASHFRPRSPFRRMLISLTGKLHRALMKQGYDEHSHDLIPATAK